MLRLSKRPAPQLSGSCSVCFVNNGVVSIAYQFEPDGFPENISEEDRAEPVQARLLQHVSEWHVSMFVVSDFTYTVICNCYCFNVASNIRFYPD